MIFDSQARQARLSRQIGLDPGGTATKGPKREEQTVTMKGWAVNRSTSAAQPPTTQRRSFWTTPSQV